MGMKHLCMIFGITPSTCSEIFNKLLTKVVHKLIRHPLARVQFPNTEKMEYFARLIHQCEPEVDDVIGCFGWSFIDLRVYIRDVGAELNVQWIP